MHSFMHTLSKVAREILQSLEGPFMGPRITESVQLSIPRAKVPVATLNRFRSGRFPC